MRALLSGLNIYGRGLRVVGRDVCKEDWVMFCFIYVLDRFFRMFCGSLAGRETDVNLVCIWEVKVIKIHQCYV